MRSRRKAFKIAAGCGKRSKKDNLLSYLRSKAYWAILWWQTDYSNKVQKVQIAATDKHRVFPKGKKPLLKLNNDSNRASRAGSVRAENLPSTVTKVDWMWDNYVHSSSYGAFLLCNFNENKKVSKFAFIFAFLNPYPLRDVFSRALWQLNDRPKVIWLCDDMSEATLRWDSGAGTISGETAKACIKDTTATLKISGTFQGT